MHKSLPRRFAIAVDQHINFVYRIEKVILDQVDNCDVSKFYGEPSEDGSLQLVDTIPPIFSSEYISHNGNLIEIEFCIVPIIFYTHYNHQTYPLVIIRNFNRIQRHVRTHPSQVDSIIPSSNEFRVRDLLRYIFEHMESFDNYPNQRRWPNGLRPYPEEFNYDFNWRDISPPRLPRVRYHSPSPPPTPPSPSPPTPPTAQQDKPKKKKPTPAMPAERIALALARDSIAQGEICPITQDKLQATKIGVTGCLCVFQGEALEKFTGSSCPSCRSPLTVRYVIINKEETGITQTTVYASVHGSD